MMYLCILLLTALTNGNVIQNTRLKRAAILSAPLLVQITAVDPPGFQVDWTPVVSLDSEDPVIGYKVKIWEFPEEIIYKYDTVDGVKTLIESFQSPEIDTKNVPDIKPMEILTAADKTHAEREIKLGSLYEVRVQAYTKYEEGPFSLPTRMFLEKPDPEHS